MSTNRGRMQMIRHNGGKGDANHPHVYLVWSPVCKTYELSKTGDQERLPIVLDDPGWFAWLEGTSCFAFVGQHGCYTARQEANAQGKRSWYAYVTQGGRLCKTYLGKSTAVTQARLESVAAKLCAPPAAEHTHQDQLLPTTVQETTPAPHHGTMPSFPEHAQLHLLTTKLHAPRLRTRLVSRTHLLRLLQRGIDGPLTLLSAPAGFGKTTLLAQWLVESGLPVAWFSLEPEDNDPTRFLTYLIAALQTLDPQIAATTPAMLHTPQPPSPETVLALLVRELAEWEGGDFVLVLDDYHLITAETLQRGMTFLLEHLPPAMHLILSTRTDPPLPLSRLRACGQLTEVRTDDLRFDLEEVGTFLREVMRLDLETSAISTLEGRTEGWIAGLQLAALSLQGKTDVTRFLETFAGTHHYVQDYLSEEVLARQPNGVQQFLLRTSVLDRLSGPLCDAVTEQEGSQAMLETLYRANLFVVALDDERGWYRYHHLFAEMLRRSLQQRESGVVAELHRRASAWYEQHGLSVEAVHHALATPDADHAACLIEPIALSMVLQGQVSTVLEWLHALPEAHVHTHPFLCICHAVVLMFTNQLEAAEALLCKAEQGVQAGRLAERERTILGHVFIIRAIIAYFSGHILRSVSLARQALELLPLTEATPRVAAMLATGFTYQIDGDVTPAAEYEIAKTAAFARTSGDLFATEISLWQLAQMYVLQGKLRKATAVYEQIMQTVPHLEVLHTLFPGIYYYFGWGSLLYEWNELEAAGQHLMQGMALLNERIPVEPTTAILGYVTFARLQQACGNAMAALAALDHMAYLAQQRRIAPHLMGRGSAVQAQLELAQGNITAATRWVDSSSLSTQDADLPYPLEGEYLALARVRIAQERGEPTSPLLQEILHLLDRLQKSAEASARLGSVLEILIVRALALAAQEDRTAALATLERALVQAAPEGYIRLFVDEGTPMRDLLRRAQVHSTVPGYVATLLAAFGEPSHADHSSLAPSSGGLLEPLTEREREVLHLLLTGASNREIAQRLVLSVNTVKRHVYNLCGKFGVRSRAQVIIRARNPPQERPGSFAL